MQPPAGYAQNRRISDSLCKFLEITGLSGVSLTCARQGVVGFHEYFGQPLSGRYPWDLGPVPLSSKTRYPQHLQGGDWCTRYENLGDKDGKRNCLERRDKTGLQGGTTRDDPSDLSLDRMGQEYGQLDTNPDRNPLMHDWNKVYVRNCDGSSFTSARRDVKRVDGEIIFFRGKFILDEVLEDLLLRRHLSFATDVVVSGCSAGGLAVYIHTDRIEEAIRHDAKAAGRSLGDVSSINVVALADSGFFLHHAGGSGDCNFIQRMQFLFLEMNISSSIQPACADAFEDNDRYKCLFAETAIHFSKARTFTLQSINDGWQLRWIGCNAADDAEKRAWYGNEMWEALDLAMRHPKNGGFIDACQHHCHCYENVVIDGDNQAEAFEKFYNDDPRRVWRTKICDIKLEGECPLKSS